jgi:hypothetical protein
MITRKMRLFCALTLVLIVSAIFSGCTSKANDTPVQVTDPSIKNWQLNLNGTQENFLTIDDLHRFPVATGHCYAVSTTGIRFGPYLCTGVDLRDLIADVGGMGPDDQVWISAPDGYMWVFDAEQLEGKGFVTFNADLKEIPSPPLRIILMYEQDKKPVSYDDGGPARIAIVSDNPGVITEGSAWVKWVDTIEIKKK